MKAMVRWTLKALKHEYPYRLRVGNYRVFFTESEDSGVAIVRIEEVKKRNERTY